MKHDFVKSIYLVKQFQLVGTLVEKCSKRYTFFTNCRRELYAKENMNCLKNTAFTPHLCYKEMITVIMPNTTIRSKASKIVIKNRC